MGVIYKTKVNSNFDFIVTNEDVSNLDVLESTNNEFHIIQQNKSYKGRITKSDFNSKSYQIKINNNSYSVDISDDLDILIKDMGYAIGSTKHVNLIKAPMPGLILEINIDIGQEVKEDDSLLILEAMKMENIITSPRDGIIKSISANKGDAVEKNQLLIEFE